MNDLTSRREDLGLLVGAYDIHVALDRAVLNVWIPFWRNLPKALCTPRTLIYNKEILYSMLESVGSSLVSEKINLEEQVKAYREDAAIQRHAFLRNLSTAAEFSALCEAYDVTYSAEDTDMDEPFIADNDMFEGEDQADPLWKVCITFTGARGKKRLTNILTHQEFTQHFAHLATRVSVDPDPDFTTELEDILHDAATNIDDRDGFFTDRGPTLR